MFGKNERNIDWYVMQHDYVRFIGMFDILSYSKDGKLPSVLVS